MGGVEQSAGTPHGTVATCSIVTDRLVAAGWRSLAARHGLDRASVVGQLLTTATTAALPPAWQGGVDAEAATRFVASRDRESPTLLVLDRDTGEPVGLVILFETAHVDGPGVDVRIGYVLAEHVWGRGLASELVGGLVAWARHQPSIATLTGGVADDNDDSSARVLVRNGFVPIGAHGGHVTYRLHVE